jgi:cyclohexa-1,5-dienecarbonyl-CoA hydratase
MTSGALRSSLVDGLGRIILDHPPLNILTLELLRRLREELERLADAPELRVLLLSAAGRHFSAGADVTEHLPPRHHELIPEFIETIIALDAFPLPVVAAVQGRCLGGGFELVLGADLVIAGEGALFGQPEIGLGVVPPAAAALLPGRCARGWAADLVFTGDPIGAAEAERAGLVRRVVPDADLEASALTLAGRMTRHSAAALRVAKRMLRAHRHEPDTSALLWAGTEYVQSLMATEDAVEGLQAFLEKRLPVWRDR